ncbi:type III-B CRISPR module RAMP protein Cmr6 [uncultured Treponema sp.]|uniref:type III-B CRISPR module RAMP protein Cmr6 n=1 Tax=uncultured Treponema sp. TaxID=162155 RepID=UPI0025DEFFEC|nr:type III-B CRISPR module RAMP protein Cmr6 [uncultured Treponema sp.]
MNSNRNSSGYSQKHLSNASDNINSLFPVPDNQKKLLGNPNCNFSLYFPRMVNWKIEKGELKTDTENILNLKNKSDKLFEISDVRKEIERKQEKQKSYMNFLKSQGIQTFSITAKTVSPFITGLGSGHPTETGMILDRNIGIPYIPASSVKGVLRLAHAINIADGRTEIPESELEKYFGTSDQKQKNKYRGQLVVLDAYPAEIPNLKVDIMNPHFSNYYSGKGNVQPVETESPTPIKFLAVQQGTKFVFNCAFIPLKNDDKSPILTEAEIKEIEAMFSTAFEKVGFGGKTSIGYGRFKRVNGVAETSQTVQPKIVKKEDLTAGEYEAMIIDLDKRRASIFFEIVKTKDKAVLRDCKTKILSAYRKKDKVRVKIDGTKNNVGDYVVMQILSKL